MESNDITIGFALLAGLVSFISPCVLPLVPAYIGYMGGQVTQQVSAQVTGKATLRQRSSTMIHALFFVLGFTLFFVLFGLFTTAAVSSLTSVGVSEDDVRNGIARIGGAAVIFFALHIMGVLNRILMWLSKRAAQLDQNSYGNVISMLVGLALLALTYWLVVESWFLTLVTLLLFLQIFRDALKADTSGQFWTRVIERIQYALYVDTRRQNQPSNRYGYFGSMFMGIVFSAGWTPCIGPIYAGILAIAADGQDITRAGILLTVYSMGLGIPFLLTAAALDQAQGVFRRLQRNMHKIEVFSGVFLLLIGVLVFTGQLQKLSARLSGSGSLGEMSTNLEECTIALVEGRISGGNWPNCVGDGVKDSFYVASIKTVMQVPVNNSSAESSGLSAPDLGAPNETSSIPIGLEEGKRAPDFTTTTLDGQTVKLSDYRGKVVLLSFWATWCEPCKAEMPDFQTIYNLYGGDFVVLAVNNTIAEADQAQIGEFVNAHDLTFPILLDETGEINGSLYQVAGYPTNILLDANGVIIKLKQGPFEGDELLDILNQNLS